jgi:putative aldouronate transport system permease protein
MSLLLAPHSQINRMDVQAVKKRRLTEINYHIMLLPGVILLILFSIQPMVGAVIAFENFIPTKGLFGSKWVGLDNFKYMMLFPDIKQVFYNTIFIAVMKIIGYLIVSLAFALLLNEVRLKFAKRAIQTIVYLPHFMSWVLLSAIFIDLMSLNGVVNQLTGLLGIQPVMFMASNTWFPVITIATDIWKEYGFSAIIFLAALTGIDSGLYESAEIDGASRLKQTLHITLPGITTTVVLLATLSLGGVMDANFDQIFNMYNPLVYQSGDIIDTYVYRVGLQNTQYGLATAIGLLKSVVSFILIIVSYALASKFANYKIF